MGMGLFDILNNPEIRSVLTSLTGQAKEGFRQISQKQPQGMGGLLGAGALGALVGSMLPKAGARTAGMIGLGAIAWNFYKKWAAGQQEKQPAGGDPAGFGPESQFFYTGPNTGQETAQDKTAMLLLRTMVFAARADGHIDEKEQERIAKVLPQFFPDEDVRPILNRLLSEAPDIAALAREVVSQEQAEDLYRLSCIIVDVDNFMERGYFTELASALSITDDRARELEAEASVAKNQLASL
ncbi:MAG: tellurite resistance TerB family protein [Desulfovibrio sp.]|nr:tellurite resistance TerB family protein [Desulfovibrio sp.]